MTSDAQLTVSRSLVWHGALMSLLGLLSGFTTMFAKAPTAALSAHTIGVLQGALLFGLAGAWHLVQAAPGTARLVKYALLIGLYANWLGAQLAGLWSAKGMFVVTGSAMPPGVSPWMETVVAILLNVSVLVIVGCAVILWCSRKGACPK
ncbi:MAG TPA: hypothetical protein VJS92_04345 [Candidatus Polarisedimenticolaceae bacterium]|nr:hypothetical protein [Candidatus Polarisedimenticolaceae bacterium]